MSRRKVITRVVVLVLAAVLFALWQLWVGLPIKALKEKNPRAVRNLVIAHRAASYWAPEETEPAYRLARDLGADYLEIDAQRTKDGVLVAFHDDTPKRTTNVAEVFPGREGQNICEFTLAELKQLDAGQWFNKAFPDRARNSYTGQKILAVSEVLDIAAEKGGKYPVYIETKAPSRHPGFEKDLVELLGRRGWLEERPGPVPMVFFQSFYADSLEKLKELAPNTPRVYLMMPATVKAEGGWNALLDKTCKIADGIGPVAYMCLQPWRMAAAHRRGLVIHPFTLNEKWQYRMCAWLGADGMFTDRCDLLQEYYGKPSKSKAGEILATLGY